MLKHIFENKVEFYITNVCNLTCDNCNRFNNHKFAGWQRWSDYADTWRQWSEYIDIKNIVLMGGEPTLNSTLNEWVTGLTEIFGSSIQILSNGIHLNKVPGLYDSLAQTRDRGGPVPGCVQISLHNLDHFEQIRNNIKTFLSTPAHEYGQVLGIANGDQPMNSMYYSLRDINDVVVNVHLANQFHTASIQPTPDGRFTLHNSDPDIAHKKCGFAQYKCYHFIRGKLYKCGPVALMPEFDEQFDLDISKPDRKLLHGYRPLEIKDWPKKALRWLAQLDDPIAQCKFCPQTFSSKIIYPVVKNSKA
jgi:organic radical activating enzyme